MRPTLLFLCYIPFGLNWDHTYLIMSIYHIIIKTNYQPEWGARFEKFWTALKTTGIKTDERALYIEDESQLELVYALALENNIALRLVKEV